jgi:hypothetical protein
LSYNPFNLNRHTYPITALKDGILDECVSKQQTLEADPAMMARYEEILIVVYKATGEVLASDMITPTKYPFAFATDDVKRHSKNAIEHIWPGQEEVLVPLALFSFSLSLSPLFSLFSVSCSPLSFSITHTCT